jgi:hypothetical protein
MQIPKAKKGNKYLNKKVEVDGITFDSRKESQAYIYLKKLQEEGAITNLTLQPKWEILPGIKEKFIKHLKTKDKECERTVQLPITYTADFLFEVNGQRVCLDVKPCKSLTPQVFFLKKKMMRYFHGIDVIEVYKISEIQTIIDQHGFTNTNQQDS